MMMMMMVSESNIIKIIGLHDDNDDYNTSFAISLFPPKVVIDVSTLSTLLCDFSLLNLCILIQDLQK